MSSEMAAEDLQSSFAETNDLLLIQSMTLQLKHKHFISPLIVKLPRKIKYPFNDKMFIRHNDPRKQYYTLEAPSSPGRPIIAPIEALQFGDDFIIAARYYENNKNKNEESSV